MIYQLIGRFASYNDCVNHSFMFVRLTHQRSRTFKSTSKIQLQFINDDSFATISYGMHCNTQPRRSFLTIFVSGEVSYIFLCVIFTQFLTQKGSVGLWGNYIQSNHVRRDTNLKPKYIISVLNIYKPNLMR